MTNGGQPENEERVFLPELLENFGFNPPQISTVLSGMDSISEFSIALGEISDDERAQLSSLSSPLMAMLVLELDDTFLGFEGRYALLGDLLGEIIRATYQLGKVKGRNDATTEEA